MAMPSTPSRGTTNRFDSDNRTGEKKDPSKSVSPSSMFDESGEAKFAHLTGAAKVAKIFQVFQAASDTILQ